MKIGIVAWRDLCHPQAGGSEVLIDLLARGAQSRGHDVALVAGTPTEPRPYPVHPSAGTLTQYLVAPRVARRHLADADVIVDVSNGIPFFSPMWTRQPVVELVHHVHTRQWRQHFGPVAAAVGSYLERRVVPRVYRSALHIAVSASTKSDLVRLGVDGSRIHLVHNPVSPRQPMAKSPTPLFVMLGRLAPAKRVDLVLKHWPSIAAQTGGELVIIGDGPERAKLEGLAGQGVRFAGRVDDAVKNELLGRAWMLLHASQHEGWGVAVMEAAAAGTPAVAFNAPGVRDAVVDGSTGMLANTDREFVQLWSALSGDEARRAEMGEQARCRALDFTPEATVNAFLQVCDRAIIEARLRSTVSRSSLQLSLGGHVRHRLDDSSSHFGGGYGWPAEPIAAEAPQ
jgi:glycosyltransferase involved in cell wall biosynthesis